MQIQSRLLQMFCYLLFYCFCTVIRFLIQGHSSAGSFSNASSDFCVCWLFFWKERCCTVIPSLVQECARADHGQVCNIDILRYYRLVKMMIMNSEQMKNCRKWKINIIKKTINQVIWLFETHISFLCSFFIYTSKSVHIPERAMLKGL